jgi:hypothetical protein
MITVRLTNDVIICFPLLEGDRLIPMNDHLEICLHNSPNPVQIHCTCEPEDIKLYVTQSESHLIIQNSIIEGIDARTPDPMFTGPTYISSDTEQGFSLN